MYLHNWCFLYWRWTQQHQQQLLLSHLELKCVMCYVIVLSIYYCAQYIAYPLWTCHCYSYSIAIVILQRYTNVHSGSHKKPSFVHRNVTQWIYRQRYLHFPAQLSELYYLRSCCMQQEMCQRSSYPPISVEYQALQKFVSDSTIFVTSNKLCSSQEVYRIVWSSSRCFQGHRHTSMSPPVPHVHPICLIATPMHVSPCTPSTPHMSNLIPHKHPFMHTPPQSSC